MKNYYAFDMESVTILNSDSDWFKLYPLGITIATTATPDLCVTSYLADGITHDNRIAPAMEVAALQELADDLIGMANKGYTIATWNGVGYDFRLLAYELCYVGDLDRMLVIADLAYSDKHADLAYQMVCEKGFMCKLDNALRAMNLPTKTDGVVGTDITELWKTNQELAIEYAENDAIITAMLYAAVATHNGMAYYTKSGDMYTWKLPDGILTVQQASKLVGPKKPFWTRDKFDNWITMLLDSTWVTYKVTAWKTKSIEDSMYIEAPSKGVAMLYYIEMHDYAIYESAQVVEVLDALNPHIESHTRSDVLQLVPYADELRNRYDKHFHFI